MAEHYTATNGQFQGGAAYQFIQTLFEPDDWIEVRILLGNTPPVCRWHPARTITDGVIANIAEQHVGKNIYVGANPRKGMGGKDGAAVALARNVFVDFDHVPEQEARLRIETARLPAPTMIVASGHGFHFYWRLLEPMTDLALWTGYQKALIAAVNSDPRIFDPPRIMRWPGFPNCKAEPVPTSILECDANRAYELMEFPAPAADSNKEQPEDTPKDNPPRRASIAACLPAMLAIGPSEKENDGSNRLLAVACRCVEHGLSDTDSICAIRAYEQVVSFPKRWTDADILRRVRDAEKKTKRGSASPTDSTPDNPGPPWLSIGDIAMRPEFARGLQPVTTGFNALDDVFRGGLRAESVYLLGARTGYGKTTLGLNIARRCAVDGNGVLVFKLEESPTEALWRILAATSQVPLSVFLDGRARAAEHREAVAVGWNMIKGLPIRFSDQRNLAAIQRISKQHAEQGGKLIIIDQLSMIEVPNTVIGYDRATHISNAIRLLARDVQLPILMLVQVNREASKKDATKHPLTVNDLRDSGCLENDAAGVIFINQTRRPDGPRYGDPCWYIDILIGKNRYGGVTDPKEPLQLLWWPKTCRIVDAAQMAQEDAT